MKRISTEIPSNTNHENKANRRARAAMWVAGKALKSESMVPAHIAEDLVTQVGGFQKQAGTRVGLEGREGYSAQTPDVLQGKFITGNDAYGPKTGFDLQARAVNSLDQAVDMTLSGKRRKSIALGPIAGSRRAKIANKAVSYASKRAGGTHRLVPNVPDRKAV